MSDLSANPSPRPVSLVPVLAILGTFALFLLIVYFAYLPRQTGAFSDDGIRTPAQRKEILADLHAKQMKQAASYAWVDQKAGVVQLPIERAMELTVQQYGAKNAAKK
jgi:hypothetical protein